MTKERKYEIQISQDKKYDLEISKTALANLDLNPSSQIIVAREINSAINEGFEIQNFLEALNERFFEGKGKIEPFSEYSDIVFYAPEKEKGEDEDASSRFKRYFSTKYETNSVCATTSLKIEDHDLMSKFKGDRTPEYLEIKVHQDIDVVSKRIFLNVDAILDFSKSWNGFQDAEVYLRQMGYGRIIGFSLNSLPSGETMGKQLMQNTLEILEELGAQGFISAKEEENEENGQAEEKSDV
jgi:hypothetical protein